MSNEEEEKDRKEEELSPSKEDDKDPVADDKDRFEFQEFETIEKSIKEDDTEKP